MKKLIIIADTNDADYITSIKTITDDELKLIQPMIQAIKNFEPYKGLSIGGVTWNHTSNYSWGECTREDLGELSANDYYVSKGITEEEFEIFDDYVPCSEYGVHTIHKIIVYDIIKETNLL